MKIIHPLALGILLVSLAVGCAPTANTGPLVEHKSAYNFTVDNSRCQGTYRNLFIYRNNVILGQVQGEPRVFLDVPAGSADYKAAPVLGTSRPFLKTIRLEDNSTWQVCP